MVLFKNRSLRKLHTHFTIYRLKLHMANSAMAKPRDILRAWGQANPITVWAA